MGLKKKQKSQAIRGISQFDLLKSHLIICFLQSITMTGNVFRALCDRETEHN